MSSLTGKRTGVSILEDVDLVCSKRCVDVSMEMWRKTLGAYLEVNGEHGG